MKVTQDVITDLLPAYLAGEASRDTTNLIEEFLRQNPEFSRIVQAQRQAFGAQPELLEPVSKLSSDHELLTLSRTRAQMERQKWSMAVALMLTALPLSFVFSHGHLTFLLGRDQPLMASAAWFGAVVLWIQYFVGRRRLRTTGL